MAARWCTQTPSDKVRFLASSSMEIVMNRPKMFAREELDDDDNTYWEFASPYTIDDDKIIWFRVRQRLSSNRIEWYADHDAELGGKTGDFWLTIDDAKRDIKKAFDNILRSEPA